MKRQVPIASLLYEYLFPPHTRKPDDPPSFSVHLTHHLVPEVRIEVATFYGDLNSTEARYPGLNYCYPPHRMRLGRFKHHRRLFEAFDALGLTYHEIQDFCCWEGTKWARERYEKDEGITVVDTTGDDIPPYVDQRDADARAAPARRRPIHPARPARDGVAVTAPAADRRDRPRASGYSGHGRLVEENDDDEDEDMSDADADADGPHTDTETVRETPAEAAARQQHVAELTRRREHAINQRIIAAWEQGQSLPPEIEQFLKEQSERGTLSAGLDLRSLLGSNRATSGYALLPTPSAAPRAPRAQVGARAAA